MYNYTNYTPSNDRFSVYTSNQNEVHTLSRKLKLPIDDVIVAVQEVGFDAEEVEEYIRDRYNRC